MKRILKGLHSLVGVLALVGLTMAARTAFAQSAAQPDSPSVEERDVAALIGQGADAILRAMSDYLTGAEQFSFRAEMAEEALGEDTPPIEYRRRTTVAIARPDRVRAVTKAARVDRVTWFDGKTLTVWTADTNTYGQIEIPGTIDEALDRLADEYDIYPDLGDLLYSDLYDVLTENIEKGAYAGLHEVNGVLCHHLVFQQKSIDWQIWIDAGLQRVPRRITIRYKDRPGQPRWSADLYDWDFAPRFPVDLFVPMFPKSAAKIDFIAVVEEATAK